ncbi:MAG: hypothetical protein KDG58_21970, partial [Anaerolineae bacterium]|nr:hypothetical protein [Anaerolineae bacterium]
LLEPEFFERIGGREAWVNMNMIKRLLRWLDVEIIDEGVLDVPPWPDTVMPAGQVLEKLGVRSERM